MYQNERADWPGRIYPAMDSYNIRADRIMKIYPSSLLAHTTKDFYEMIEPLNIIELECTCKDIKENWKHRDSHGYFELEEMCQSCKRYFDIVQTFVMEKNK